MHQIAPFQNRFCKIFWGGAHRAPSPDPSPVLVSGCALDSGFVLSFHAVPGNRSQKFLDPPLLSGWYKSIFRTHPLFFVWLRHWTTMFCLFLEKTSKLHKLSLLFYDMMIIRHCLHVMLYKCTHQIFCTSNNSHVGISFQSRRRSMNCWLVWQFVIQCGWMLWMRNYRMERQMESWMVVRVSRNSTKSSINLHLRTRRRSSKPVGVGHRNVLVWKFWCRS